VSVRVEVDDDGPLRREGDGVTVLVGEFEGGGRIADGEHTVGLRGYDEDPPVR